MTCNNKCIHYSICEQRKFEFAKIEECPYYNAKCKTCKYYNRVYEHCHHPYFETDDPYTWMVLDMTPDDYCSKYEEREE